MKIQVEYWYPYQAEMRRKAEVEIPDSVDPMDWVEENKRDWVNKEVGEDISSVAFDLGYAGIRILKDWK